MQSQNSCLGNDRKVGSRRGFDQATNCIVFLRTTSSFKEQELQVTDEFRVAGRGSHWVD